MSDQVTQTQVTLFENNMRLALNQTTPKVYPYVPTRGARSGAGGSLVELDDIIGQVQSRKGSGDGRHGDVQYANTGHSRVWIAKPDFDYYADLVDNNDQVQAAIQIASGYMQTAVATINRAKDDAFFAGFFGNMLTGASQAGLVSVPFPAGNVIAHDVGGVAGTGTGLNVAKVKAAAKLLGQQFNDRDERAFMIVTADDKDQLLNEALFINLDFGATGSELQNGQLRKLMGFEFIEMESENPLFWNAGLLDARRRRAQDALLEGKRHGRLPLVGHEDLSRSAADQARIDRRSTPRSASAAPAPTAARSATSLNKRN
jgi:hypothetical protein